MPAPELRETEALHNTANQLAIAPPPSAPLPTLVPCQQLGKGHWRQRMDVVGAGGPDLRPEKHAFKRPHHVPARAEEG